MASPKRHDVFTVLAIGIVVYLVKNVVHEGVGHGGVSLLVGGKPIAISSAWWNGDYAEVTAWGRRWINAGGTLANLVLAFGLLPWWPRFRRATPTVAYFVWLTIVVNLLSGGGYMMVDPLFGFGDWTGFLNGLEPSWLPRSAIVGVGVAVSLFGVFWGRSTITSFLPGEPEARKRGLLALCFGPYLAGGAVFVTSAAFNPGGTQFLITVALATFGGTAWLAWFLPFMVRNGNDEPMFVPSSRNWRALGIGAALFTIAVLGPSIRF